MVFAHVGFAADGPHKDLTVDYSKSCVQVYTDFARYLEWKYGTITLLEQIGEEKSLVHLQNLPSWVPDWTTPLTTKRFPMHTGLNLQPSNFWVGVPEQEIPSYGVEYFDTVLFTSSELSLEQIPSDIRQGIALELAQVNWLFAELEEYPWIMQEDISFLLELWPMVYQIWREVILDDNVLPPKLVDMALSWGRLGLRTEGNGRELFLSVPICLILAFHPDVAANYLNGRALARTSRGMLALVPRSTREGDFITPLTGRNRNRKGFVFRPLQLPDESMGFDARAFNTSVKKMLPDLEQSAMHCKVVGGCLRDGFHIGRIDLTGIYGRPRRFVMALH
jgi:hypothetical protein